MIGGLATTPDLGVHNSNIVNLERGVLERVFFVKDGDGFSRPPQPIYGAFKRKLSYFKDIIVRGMLPTTPIKRQEFPLLYRGRRRTVYENAVASLTRKDVDAADARVKCFVKAEKINFSAKKDPAPRIISPRDPRYNVAVGCYLKPIEHSVYRSIANAFGDTTVAKGLNVEEVANLLWKKWSSFEDPVAVGLDASRFDQHVSIDALRWEHSVYNGIFRDSQLAKLLSWQLRTKCVGYLPDGKLKYTTEGTRMSGDMNTAMGNCLIMCALVHAHAKEMHIPIKLVNNGDDCVVIMSSRHLRRYTAGLHNWFHDMGFNMKVEEPVRTFEQIEFCQMHPVFDGTTFIMVRNPNISIAKDSLSIKPLNSESIFRKWVGAVGEGGLSLTGGIPILQSFYMCMERASRGKRLKDDPTQETGWWFLSKNMHRKASNVADAARYSFYVAFDILPDMQVAVERYYDSFEPRWGKPELGWPSRPNIWLSK